MEASTTLTALERAQVQIAHVEAQQREVRNQGYEYQRQLQALSREMGERESMERRRVALEQGIADCADFVRACHAWLLQAPSTISTRRGELSRHQNRIKDAQEKTEKLEKQLVQQREQQAALALAIATAENELVTTKANQFSAESDYDQLVLRDITLLPLPQLENEESVDK